MKVTTQCSKVSIISFHSHKIPSMPKYQDTWKDYFESFLETTAVCVTPKLAAGFCNKLLPYSPSTLSSFHIILSNIILSARLHVLVCFHPGPALFFLCEGTVEKGR